MGGQSTNSSSDKEGRSRNGEGGKTSDGRVQGAEGCHGGWHHKLGGSHDMQSYGYGMQETAESTTATAAATATATAAAAAAGRGGGDEMAGEKGHLGSEMQTLDALDRLEGGTQVAVAPRPVTGDGQIGEPGQAGGDALAPGKLAVPEVQPVSESQKEGQRGPCGRRSNLRYRAGAES